MDIREVAEWFLQQDSMTPKKLQKMCYYAQAWHYTLYNEELFSEKIEAWVHGPVSRVSYREYADYRWNNIPKSKDVSVILSDEQEDTLKAVLETYGEFSGDQLEALTHSEDPWIKARGNCEEWESCTTEITIDSMKEYYSKKFEDAQGE